MKIIIINGAQWGDEGKGKISYYLSKISDISVRSNGGSNAEHTIHVNGNAVRFRMLPMGVINGNTGLVTNNVLINLNWLERDLLKLNEVRTDQPHIIIGENAHVVLQKHICQDKTIDKVINLETIGQGIGPALADKKLRTGITLKELLADGESRFPELYEKALKLKKYVGSCVDFIYKNAMGDKTILIEGAQGFMLDNTFGTYPHVTSSDTTAAGLISGAGLPFKYVNRNIAVVKAYITRYSTGFFPTRCNLDQEKSLREYGGEFGTYNQKPMQCGWFDLVALRYAQQINHYTELCINKLDILSKFHEIPVCHQYKYKNRQMDFLPEWTGMYGEDCKPVYKIMRGWKKDISGIHDFDALPQAAKDYIHYIEDQTEIPVSMIGTGPANEDIIIRKRGLISNSFKNVRQFYNPLLYA